MKPKELCTEGSRGGNGPHNYSEVVLLLGRLHDKGFSKLMKTANRIFQYYIHMQMTNLC